MDYETEQPLSDVQTAATSTARTTSANLASGSTKPRKSRSASGSTKPKIGGLKTPKEKPPKVQGYYWRTEAGGWQLRRSGKKGDLDKDRYIGRLSGEKYEEMKRKYSGKSLDDALTRWVVNQVEMSE